MLPVESLQRIFNKHVITHDHACSWAKVPVTWFYILFKLQTRALGSFCKFAIPFLFLFLFFVLCGVALSQVGLMHDPHMSHQIKNYNGTLKRGRLKFQPRHSIEKRVVAAGFVRSALETTSSRDSREKTKMYTACRTKKRKAWRI